MQRDTAAARWKTLDAGFGRLKTVPLSCERVNLQIRGEIYKAYNHTQFTSWITSETFDAQGNQANALFAQATEPCGAPQPNGSTGLVLTAYAG